MDLALAFEYGYLVMHVLLLDKFLVLKSLIFRLFFAFFHHAILNVTSLYRAIYCIASEGGSRYF